MDYLWTTGRRNSKITVFKPREGGGNNYPCYQQSIRVEIRGTSVERFAVLLYKNLGRRAIDGRESQILRTQGAS